MNSKISRIATDSLTDFHNRPARMIDWNKSEIAEFNQPESSHRFGWVTGLANKTFIVGQKEFVLESHGRAILAFLADGLGQAKDLCSQDWFREDLSSYRSGGQPLWDGTADLQIRCARPPEAAEIQVALATEQCRSEYDGYAFAFLVPIDGSLH